MNRIHVMQAIHKIIVSDPTLVLGLISPMASDKAYAMSDLAAAVSIHFPEDDGRPISPLFSASPELLAALELYDKWDKMPADRGGKDGPNGKAYAAFVSAKDAAIAKARGK